MQQRVSGGSNTFRRILVAVVVAATALLGLPAVAHAAVTPAISVTGPATSASGTALTLTGQLTADAAAGVSVAVVEQRTVDGPAPVTKRILPEVSTGTGGAFTVIVTPLTPGHLRYTASATVGGVTVSAGADVTVTGSDAYLWMPSVTGLSGHAYTVQGTLHEYLGAPIGGAVLHVTKRIGLPAAITEPDVVSHADGTFSITATDHGATVVIYTVTWDGDGTHPAVTGTVRVGVTLVPTTITASPASSPVKLNQAFTVTGVLAFGEGESVGAGRMLGVSRTVNGPVTALPAVPVAADGSFTFSDTSPEAGAVSYTISYAGDADHKAASRQLQASVTPLDTTITVALAPGQSAVWGQWITVTGKITLEAPGTPSSADLLITTSGSCTNDYQWRGTVAADGTFTASVKPACVNDLVVQAAYGDVTHARATAVTASVPVSKAPGLIRVYFGGSGRGNVTDWLSPTGVQPSVDWGYGNGRLDVYAQPLGKARTLVARLTLINGYTPGFTYSPQVRTTFTFVWFGDAGTAASSTTSVLLVRPYLHQQLELARRKSGAWLVYSTKTNPLSTANVVPNHTGQVMRLVIDQYVSGKWRRVTVRTARLDRWGFAQIRLTGRHVSGTRFRIQAYWAGDTANMATTTGWIFYRFA